MLRQKIKAKAKSAWLKETCSGKYDSQAPVVASPAEAGSMCPVEHGGSHGFNLGTTETCSICLEVMDAASNVLTLKCGHIFHRECVLNQRGRKCALCRVTISKNVWAGSGICVARAPSCRGTCLATTHCVLYPTPPLLIVTRGNS